MQPRRARKKQASTWARLGPDSAYRWRRHYRRRCRRRRQQRRRRRRSRRQRYQGGARPDACGAAKRRDRRPGQRPGHARRILPLRLLALRRLCAEHGAQHRERLRQYRQAADRLPPAGAGSATMLTASEAALCAGEQNHYWDFHDLAVRQLLNGQSLQQGQPQAVRERPWAGHRRLQLLPRLR